MKFHFFLLLLLLIAYVKSDTNCKDIKPNKASDCLLSKEDKKSYKYCCYEKTSTKEECNAYDETDYKMIKDFYKTFYGDLNLEYTLDCNFSSFLKLAKIIALFILL